MYDLRFMLVTVAIFCGAFVGVSFGVPWMSQRQSVAPAAAVARPDIATVEQPIAATIQPSIPDTPPPKQVATAPAAPAAVVAVPQPARTTAPTPLAERRGQLAQTAMQAADAYARAPCDPMAKAAFIVAASTYLRAQDAASQAPKDARVHEAIKAAFESGNIGGGDFPSDTVFSGRSSASPAKAGCVNSAGLRP